MTALYIFLVILAVFLLLFAVLALNAVRAKQRGRRLAPQPDYYSEAELAQHAERLAQMIRCETVSCRESFDDCRIAERTQIQVPGLNGRVEEPVKSQKTT